MLTKEASHPTGETKERPAEEKVAERKATLLLQSLEDT